ncbi:MAG: right-handed parallel beta-helix repeat-containing protein [Sphingobacteriales bacterium]|nr:MAG: right-handed parallel beta-helix repeat-containing protein [Sphingobacteriales bacterium]
MKTQQLLFGAAIVATAFASCKKDETKPSDTPTTPVSKKDTLSGEVSGTWEKSSMHFIKGDIFIAEGKSLIIEEGVTIVMDPSVKPEFIIKGNLYAMGTAAAPVTFTVPDGNKAQFGDQWGGLMAGPTCKELLLDHVIMEQGGAVTTEQSSSVKAGFYKAEAGEHVPVLWYGGDGKLVVTNSTIRNFNEDGMYIEGGDVLVSNNMIHTTGVAGGDAINIKSGVHADIAFNVIYSPNTNGLKLSNSGDRPRQAYVIGYNNTILNAGWRRPTTKGGSIWLEKSIQADLYNNLLVNDRYGVKRDKGNPEDSRSKISNTYYYGFTKECVDQFQPTDEIVAGVNGDIRGINAGENDPQFENYSLSTDMANADFNASWDMHLKATSPALTGGKTDFTRHFSGGITMNGKAYTSPAPQAYYGALGKK